MSSRRDRGFYSPGWRPKTQAEDLPIRLERKRKAEAIYQQRYNTNPYKPAHPKATGQTEYYFENGLRKVYPYYFNFTVYAKGRWYGRTILEVLTEEFKDRPEEKYRVDIEAGRLTVNGKKITPDHRLGNNELLEHICHRHENAVVATPIQFISESPEVVVINKPPSIPCHPCGRYRHNTISYILEKEFGYKNLRTLNRLDRMISGVLILPRTKHSSKVMETQQAANEIRKEYICRVQGKFPDGTVVCDQPLSQFSPRVALYRVDPNGKDSRTSFTRLSFNGNSSVVSCILHTARTHQIRVHLQFLGFPIINDTIYNNTLFGVEKGKGGVFDKPALEIEEEVMWVQNSGMLTIGDNPLFVAKFSKTEKTPEDIDTVDTYSGHTATGGESTSKVGDKATKTDEKVRSDKDIVNLGIDCNKDNADLDTTENDGEPESKKVKFPRGQGKSYDESKMELDELCKECKYLYVDPKPSQLVLFLHAYKYTGPNYDYCAGMPDWAREDWTDEDAETI